LEEQHAAFSGLEFLAAGCAMSEKERKAVENVVRGRQPVLVPLPVEVSEDEDVDQPTEVEEDEESNILEPQVVVTIEEEEGVSPPRISPPRKRCPDCPRTFKLQIQLNRHKEHCTKKEGGSMFTKKEGGSVLRIGNTPKSFTLNELKAKKLVFNKGRRSAPAEISMSRAERKAKHPTGGGNNNIVPPNGQGVPCPECGKKFFTKGKMNAHHVDIHQPGHFPCPGQKCGKVFSSKNKQTSHYSKNCSPTTELGRAGLAKRGIIIKV
jgi:hypothetical protein